MKMRITILEDIHPAGVEKLESVFDVEVRLGLSRPDQLAAAGQSDGLVVKSVIEVDEELLNAAPRLKVVGRAGTGTENIDIEAASKRGVPVLTVPGGNTVSASEFTMVQILNLCRRIGEAQQAVSRGDYRRHLLEGRELKALSVGLVGLGNVGMEVAARLAPFGCKIIGWDPAPKDPVGFAEMGGVMAGSFEDLMPQVDVLSFHVRLTPETTNMLDGPALALAKQDLLLINTSRGGVIDDQALLNALGTGKVAQAALDVIDPEPPFNAEPGTVKFEHPLLNHPNIDVTPHMAASTVDAQKRIALFLANSLVEKLSSRGDT